MGARPDKHGEKPRVKFGLKDLFVFLVYMLMALPIAQILHLIFRSWAWPVYWGEGVEAPSYSEMWGWDYMEHNSQTSDHRWYLLMVVKARLFMQIGELISCPGWLQALIYFVPCVI